MEAAVIPAAAPGVARVLGFEGCCQRVPKSGIGSARDGAAVQDQGARSGPVVASQYASAVRNRSTHAAHPIIEPPWAGTPYPTSGVRGRSAGSMFAKAPLMALLAAQGRVAIQARIDGMCSSWRWPNRSVSARDSPSIHGNASRRVTRSSGSAAIAFASRSYDRSTSSRTARTDRPSLRAWNQALIGSSSWSSLGQGGARCLATVGGGLETGDRAVPPAEEVGGEVLEAPRPHRSGLGHPVDPDLVDEVAPEPGARARRWRRAPRADRRRRPQTRSTAMATEPPPPRHSVASP